jgi:hypothetical protein
VQQQVLGIETEMALGVEGGACNQEDIRELSIS